MLSENKSLIFRVHAAGDNDPCLVFGAVLSPDMKRYVAEMCGVSTSSHEFHFHAFHTELVARDLEHVWFTSTDVNGLRSQVIWYLIELRV